jgi:hypothetical protein
LCGDAGQRTSGLNYTALLPFNADAARTRDEASEKATAAAAAAAADERSAAMATEARRPPVQRSVEVVEEEEEGGRLLRRPVWPGPTVEASSSAVSAEMKDRNTLAKLR